MSRLSQSDCSMDLADRAVGFLLCCISLTIFTYYSSGLSSCHLWTTTTLSTTTFPQEYAIIIPVLAGVALVCFLCVFIGSVMLKSKRKKA
ncbi:Dolichol-phosphate mannose synthase subunit 2 [Bienertia sinuspersici]